MRERQALQQQQEYARLRNRTDYVVGSDAVGTRAQSMQQVPLGNPQRLSAGEQIVQNPTMLKRVIMPAPVPVSNPVSKAVAKPSSSKVQKSPMVNTKSILYTGGMPTGMPVKKWPTSFKKAFHKPTSDESIMKGLNNLNNMSRKLLGGK
jgi:hypothetical protein